MTVTDFSITFASLLFPPPLLFPTQASMPSPQPHHPRGSGSGRFGFQALWGKSGTSSVGGEGVPCRSSRMTGRQSPRPSLGAPAAHRPLPPPALPRPPSALCLLPALRPLHLPKGAPPPPSLRRALSKLSPC